MIMVGVAKNVGIHWFRFWSVNVAVVFKGVMCCLHFVFANSYSVLLNRDNLFLAKMSMLIYINLRFTASTHNLVKCIYCKCKELHGLGQKM